MITSDPDVNRMCSFCSLRIIESNTLLPPPHSSLVHNFSHWKKIFNIKNHIIKILSRSKIKLTLRMSRWNIFFVLHSLWGIMNYNLNIIRFFFLLMKYSGNWKPQFLKFAICMAKLLKVKNMISKKCKPCFFEFWGIN